MIVKDESHVIERCLRSVRQIIDHWIIIDTGSTDNTVDVISDVMHDIPGQIHRRSWVDFAHNRTEAIRLAEPYGSYLLIIDADDELLISEGFKTPQLTHDSYNMTIHYNGNIYKRTQLIKSDLKWFYRGILHEFLESAQAKSIGEFPVIMKINHEGARSKNTETYKNDALLLTSALETENDPLLRSRYTFYLAQSYFDAGDYEAAQFFYQIRTTQGHWSEEVYYSLLRIAQCNELLHKEFDETLRAFEQANNFEPKRIEGLHGAARLCRLHDKFEKGYAIAKRGRGIGLPPNGLFVSKWIYDYGLLDELAVCAYWIGEYVDCIDSTLSALESGQVPRSEQARLFDNMRHSLNKVRFGD